MSKVCAMGMVVATLASGCYAELVGGAYKVSNPTSGSMLAADDALEETGVSVGLNLGMHFDFWKTTRIAFAYGGDLGIVGSESGGSAVVNASGFGVRLDQKLLALGDKHVIAGTGYFHSGTGSAKFTPMGGTEADASATDSIELYAGLTLGLYDSADPVYANWAYHLSGGVAYLSNDSEGLGSVTMLGLQGRLTISWAPKIVPALFSPSVASAPRGNISTFAVDMPGNANVINGFAGAMQKAGCSVGPLEGDSVGGFCNGVKIVVMQEGSRLIVGCEAVSEATCRQTFASVIAVVE